MRNASLGDIAAAQDRRAGIEPDPRVTPAIAAGAAFLVMLVLAAMFTQFHSQFSGAVAVAVVAGVVAAIGWSSRWMGALEAAGLGWLFLNGFAVDHAGALRWHGSADVWRLAVLVCCATVGSGVRARRVAHQRCQAMVAAGFDRTGHIWHASPPPIDELVPCQRTSSTRGEQHA